MKRNNFIKALGLGIFTIPFIGKNTLLPKIPKEAVTIFTPEMLTRHNYGLFIINSKVRQITSERIGYAATVSYKLGFTLRTKEQPYTMTNFLTDGWSYEIGKNKEEVCNYLNNNPHGEKYRLMTKEEVLYIISHRKQGFL